MKGSIPNRIGKVGRSGRLAIMAITLTIPATAPAQAFDGTTLFKQRCQMCHAVTADKPATVGPNLAGVVGRKAASTGFAYSAALKASGLVWTRPVIDKYLAGPAKLVPGTKMAIALPDPAQRKAVIDYLARTK